MAFSVVVGAHGRLLGFMLPDPTPPLVFIMRGLSFIISDTLEMAAAVAPAISIVVGKVGDLKGDGGDGAEDSEVGE